MNRPSPLLTLVRTALGIALLIYVLRSGGAWDSLRVLFGFVWLVILLNVVPLVGATIEARRLAVLFRAQGLPLPFSTGFRVVTVGTLFNLLIPGGTGGDVMKLYYLSRQHPGRGIEIATILFVDRAVALFALLLFITGLLLAQRSLLTLPSMLPGILGVAMCLALLLAGTILVWSARIRGSAVYRVITERLPLGGYLARAADAAYAFRARKSALLTAALFSWGGHVLLASSLVLSGTVLVPDAPPLVVATLSLLGLVANVIPITPGGIGVGEAAAETLFRSVGIQGGAAMITAWRAGTIAVCVVGAAFYVLSGRAATREPIGRSAKPAGTAPVTSPSRMVR
jgi:uncharacterized protein (TIRG00374 family)